MFIIYNFSNAAGFGDVNISAILNSFQMGYDKRVRPNYGGKTKKRIFHFVRFQFWSVCYSECFFFGWKQHSLLNNSAEMHKFKSGRPFWAIKRIYVLCNIVKEEGNLSITFSKFKYFFIHKENTKVKNSICLARPLFWYVPYETSNIKQKQ